MTCDCTMGCHEPADPDAPEPTMCAQCNCDSTSGDTMTCTPRSSLHPEVCACGKTATECAEWPEGCHTFKDEWTNYTTVEVEAIHVDSYLLVVRNVKPSGWKPRMLWHRLRRRDLTVYMEPSEPWTDDQLVNALIEAAKESVSVEVYVNMNMKFDPPGNPDTEF